MCTYCFSETFSKLILLSFISKKKKKERYFNIHILRRVELKEITKMSSIETECKPIKIETDSHIEQLILGVDTFLLDCDGFYLDTFK